MYGNNKPESFKIYEENEKLLKVPKFYGISKFGKPEKNEEVKENVKLKFKKNYVIIKANCQDCN